MHILQLAIHDSKYSCKGARSERLQLAVMTTEGQWVSGGDAAIVVKVVVGGQVIRRCACLTTCVQGCVLCGGLRRSHAMCGGMRH